MARSLVFTNGNNETITLERSPYLITDIDGLGVPSVDVQEQQSPFIDGTVAIDTVLAPRELTVTVFIIAPNEFANIDTYRRDIVKKLNPKLGPGTLVYTTEGGTSYRIIGVPSSVVFRPKEYNTPYAEAQIVFHCHDPYWQKTTETTTSIGTIASSDEILIYNGDSTMFSPTAIRQSNGLIRVVFRTSPSGYLKQCTSYDNGLTWSGATTLFNEGARYQWWLIDSTGLIRLFYRSDNSFNLLQRTSSDGTTWSISSVVNSSDVNDICVIQDRGGYFRCVYTNTSNYICTRSSADGNTWSAEAVVLSASSASVNIIQNQDGRFFIFYYDSSPQSIKNIYSDDFSTWSSENTVVTGDVGEVNASIDISGSIRIIYKNNTTSYANQRTSLDGITWSSTSSLNFTTFSDIYILQLPSGSFIFFYINSAIDVAMKYGASILNHNSDIDIPCQVRLNGPTINPKIENLRSAEYIRIVKTLATGDYFIVDTTPGNKTVRMFISGIEQNGTAYLDINSTFFQIEPGDTALIYSDESSPSNPATATVTYRERYAGI